MGIMTQEFAELLNRLPPGWSAVDVSNEATPRTYKIIHEDSHLSYATVDGSFPLDGHIRAYWREWGDKYGC